jgi:hypothetical protein
LSYTLTALQSKLLTQIGDPNVNSSITLDALNYAEQSIFNTFDLTLNSAQQTNTVASGTNTLASALPSNFQRISNMVVTLPINYADSLKQYYLTPEKFREAYPAAGTTLYGTGPLQWWTYWNNVEFAWKTDQTYTVSVDYIKSVTLLSASSDVPTIPESFEELLILGAKIRIYEQKEDFDYASQFQNRYADLLEAFVTRYSTRQVDKQANVPGARVRV